MAGTYYPGVSAPTVAEGFLLQPESRVLLGTEYLYGSLEITSWVYSTYTASIGLQSGKSLDLGSLESLGFSHVPTFEPVESANLQNSNVWVLTGEETTLTVGVRQFDPTVLYLALGTGIRYNLADEVVITFGGKCTLSTRPVSIEFLNVACQAPTSEDISGGISGGVLTLYDCLVSSGLPWDDINAGALNVITLELQVRPVLAHALGNRLGNFYIW
jgi:hypothetical protein